MFLSGRSALQPDGSVAGLGDAAAQTHAALDSIAAALQAAGGSLRDITKLTTSLVDRAHRKPVYEAIGSRLRDVFPVGTGLLVAGLPLPELMVQIDAEAVIGSPVQRLRTFEMKDWFGQDIAWQGAMVAASETELFVRGQTGASLDGSFMAGPGRQPEDAAAQADLALSNLATLLREAGSGMDEVCKITVYIGDRAYRTAVYPVIGRHFREHSSGVHRPDRDRLRSPGDPVRDRRPCDAQARRAASTAASAIIRTPCAMVSRSSRSIATSAWPCAPALRSFCAARPAPISTRSCTAPAIPVAQAEQAMDNVAVLLGEAGAGLADVVKATVFVTDRAFLPGVTEVVLRRLNGVTPCFSALVVKGLASPELLMEVDITAVTSG